MKRRHVYDPSLKGSVENARCVVCGAPKYNAVHRPRRRRAHAPVEKAKAA